MIKNNKIYFGFILLLILIIADAALDQNLVVVLLGITGIALTSYQIRVNEDVRLVIVKNKIRRKYRNQSLKDHFVTFIELSNLSTYSQFYHLKLSDQIVEETYRLLKKIFHSNVFLYAADQLVIIQEFEHKTVINQRLRVNEQMDKLTRLMYQLEHHKFYIDKPDQYYQISITAGTGSIGVRGDYNTIDEMIRLAHFTMLRAKDRGLKCLVATEEIRIIKDDVDIFNQELTEGLRYDEIVPYFLPIIDPKTMTIIGCESLMRWEKSEYRIIEANKFRQVAEEKNLLAVMDQTILKKTFQAYRQWRQDDLIDDDFRIAVNLSLQTLSTVPIQTFVKLAHDYGIEPNNVDIDISEHDLSRATTEDAILRFKEAGFGVSIDAFHTSNEFVKVLSRISVDTIKLDRFILPDGQPDDGEYRFYRMIVKLSKLLGYRVMAKGVEHRTQLALARELNIDYVQGYYITPPLNDMKIRGFLNKYHRSVLA